MKFSIKDFFSKCDQIRRKLRFDHIYWRNPSWKTLFFAQWWKRSIILRTTRKKWWQTSGNTDLLTKLKVKISLLEEENLDLRNHLIDKYLTIQKLQRVKIKKFKNHKFKIYWIFPESPPLQSTTILKNLWATQTW